MIQKQMATQPISGRADYHLHSVKDRLIDISSASGLSMAAFPDAVRPEVFEELERMGFQVREIGSTAEDVTKKNRDSFNTR